MKRYLFSAVAPRIAKGNTPPKELKEILTTILNALSPGTFQWENVTAKIQYALADDLLFCRSAVSFNEAKKRAGVALSLSAPILQAPFSSPGTDGNVQMLLPVNIIEPYNKDEDVFVDTITFIQRCIDIILYNPRLQEITRKLANLSLTPESHSDIETSSNTASGQSKVLYSPVNVPASRLNDSSENTAQGTSTRTIEKWDGQLTKDALIAARDNINDAIGDIIEEIKTLLLPAKIIQDSIDWGLCSDLDDTWIEGYDSEEAL